MGCGVQAGRLMPPRRCELSHSRLAHCRNDAIRGLQIRSANLQRFADRFRLPGISGHLSGDLSELPARLKTIDPWVPDQRQVIA